uniref:Uncharacterized protein n=1 Tax=Anguilla anguilla TaxID=7936 RepID=A0A0E9W109_ANGAN
MRSISLATLIFLSFFFWFRHSAPLSLNTHKTNRQVIKSATPETNAKLTVQSWFCGINH